MSGMLSVKMRFAKLSKLWMQMLTHGSWKLPDRTLRLQLMVFNSTLFLVFVISALVTMLFVFFAQYAFLLNSTLPILAMFLTIYILAQKRYFLLARILLVICCLVGLGAGIIFYGKQSQLTLYCLDLALLPFLLFRSKEWRWIVLFSTLAFSLFTVIEMDIFVTATRPLHSAAAPYMKFLLASGAFIGIILPSILVFWQSNVSFRRALKRSRVLARDEKFTAIGRLAAGAAHEINNPLAIVQLTLENVEGSCEALKDKAIQHRIKKGYDAIQRIHGILQKLLASTSIPILPAERWRVQDVALIISERTGRFLKTRGISLSIRSDIRENSQVLCHRQSVIDVVDSLINNALEAMIGHNKPKIELTLKCQGVNFLIQVEDSGPGISEDIVRSIFTPFFTTKDIGTGLGLSLYSARCIAQQYGGDLTCESGPGGRFFLSLPLLNHDAQPAALHGS